MRAKTILGCLLCALLLACAIGAAPAQANRALLSKALLTMDSKLNLPPPEAQIEGACGLAVGSGGSIYVSDYHHRLVDLFSSAGSYMSQITGVGTAPEGPCGLAFGPGGALYANIWHESVIRLKPSLQTFDTTNSTGVAVDAAGNVYVNDRTYVAVYEPSGAELMKIGLGSLGDGFGVAVFGGRVYVADAANDTVKIYEPAINPAVPKFTINGSATPRGEFVSLVDGAVAVDPTNGNLLVVDNLQPGFEHPKSAVYEFDSSGAFLAQLPGAPVHGGPSGIAVDPSTGRLYVTDGNDEGSNVFSYGPFSASLGALGPPAEDSSFQAPSLAKATIALAAAPPAVASEQRSSTRPHRARRRPHKKARSGRGRAWVGRGLAVRGVG